MTDPISEPITDTVALTMTLAAAERFLRALIYAANRIPREARIHYSDQMSHEDWLRWGANRLDAECRALELEPDASRAGQEAGT